VLEVDETRREAWTVAGVIQVLERQPLLVGSVVLLLLLCALSTVVGTVIGLANFRDVDYPDSSDLLRIGEFIRSGHIYPDGNRPPYMLSLYGPLMYILLSVPYRLAQAAGITPQVLVRLAVAGAACLCVLLIYLISRRLYSSRVIALICALFAVSALDLGQWTTQIRGDFLAVALSLLSVYWFLLKNGRPQAMGAAICAGLAPLVKQTFFAAPIAIFFWLIYRRRYKEAALWAAGVALTVAGGYAMVWRRDPLMLETIAALRHPVVEYPHAVAFVFYAMGQAVVPFAVIGGVLATGKCAPDRLLFLFYCVAAWLVAILTIPHVGSNINYFWEPLVASAVLAGPGLWELQRRANRTPILSTAILLILLLWSCVPMLHKQLSYLNVSYSNISQYHFRKARWESLVATVSGRRLLSTIPDLTVLSSTPEIPDPYLNSTLEREGGWNFGPVIAQINAGVYDLVVIRNGQAEKSQGPSRGVADWNDGMWGALKRTYGPACVFENDKYMLKDPNEAAEEVWLPRRGAGEILPRLLAIGCLPVAEQVDSGAAVGSRSK
jgi:Gpi18-like mannosyltransferase